MNMMNNPNNNPNNNTMNMKNSKEDNTAKINKNEILIFIMNEIDKSKVFSSESIKNKLEEKGLDVEKDVVNVLLEELQGKNKIKVFNHTRDMKIYTKKEEKMD